MAAATARSDWQFSRLSQTSKFGVTSSSAKSAQQRSYRGAKDLALYGEEEQQELGGDSRPSEEERGGRERQQAGGDERAEIVEERVVPLMGRQQRVQRRGIPRITKVGGAFFRNDAAVQQEARQAAEEDDDRNDEQRAELAERRWMPGRVVRRLEWLGCWFGRSRTHQRCARGRASASSADMDTGSAVEISGFCFRRLA